MCFIFIYGMIVAMCNILTNPLCIKYPIGQDDSLQLEAHTMANVKFTGILVAVDFHVFEIDIPEPFKAVDHIHITLLSSELSPGARKALKGKDLSKLPPFPKVTFGTTHIADNGKKISIYADCMQQDAIRAWVEQAIAILGIDAKVDPARVYHVSIANLTGSQYDSVPDPWNHCVR